MKRWAALLVAAALLVGALPSALAAASPTPPAWVESESYLIFPGDPVYEPESWSRVEALRREALQGALLPPEGRDWASGSPGECYETGLLRLKYAANAAGDPAAVGEALLSAGKAFSAAESGWNDRIRGKDALSHRLAVEKYRAYLAYHPHYVENWGRGIIPAIDALAMPLEEFFNTPFMDRLTPQARAEAEEDIYSYWSFYLEQRNLISVYLDGGVLLMDTLPQVRDQRTMVPVRAIAEALGADVEWRPEADQVVITRAGSTVVMALDSTVAMVDGVPVKMDVAPYADSNRTYIPVRYISQFFSQKVDWEQAGRRVDITEDKSEWTGGNVEQWAGAMGGLLTLLYGGDPRIFGGYCRAPHPNTDSTRLVEPVEETREHLREEWGISDREGLLSEMEDIRAGGSNRLFLDSARQVKDHSAAQIRERTARENGEDRAVWLQTQSLWKKWGSEKGILAWDLCRQCTLAQWGYTAGYLSYSEAMALAEEAARQLRKTFASWDEVYENCADGYYWCIREDMTGTDIWDSDFGMTYQAMRATVELNRIFDASLFSVGVQGKNDSKL